MRNYQRRQERVLALFFMGKHRKSKCRRCLRLRRRLCHSSIRSSFPSRIISISILFSPRKFPASSKNISTSVKQAGFREVRLIHGKGKGVQRNIIRALLEKHANVESFHDAPLEAGSWGATVVILKT